MLGLIPTPGGVAIPLLKILHPTPVEDELDGGAEGTTLTAREGEAIADLLNDRACVVDAGSRAFVVRLGRVAGYGGVPESEVGRQRM